MERSPLYEYFREEAQENLRCAQERASLFGKEFEKLLAVPENQQSAIRRELWSLAESSLTRLTTSIDLLIQTLGPNENLPDDLGEFVQSGSYQAMLIYTCLERSIIGGSSIPQFHDQIKDQAQLVDAI